MFAKQCDSATVEIGCRVQIPRENTRRLRPTGAVPIATDAITLLIQRPQFAQVVVRLLQVIAQDLLELATAIAACVVLIGPAHELGVQNGAEALAAGRYNGVTTTKW